MTTLATLLVLFGTPIAIYAYHTSRKRQRLRQLSRILGATYRSNWIGLSTKQGADCGYVEGSLGVGRDFSAWVGSAFRSGQFTYVQCSCNAKGITAAAAMKNQRHIELDGKTFLDGIHPAELPGDLLAQGTFRIGRESLTWTAPGGSYLEDPEQLATLVHLVGRLASSVETVEIQRKIVAMI